METWVSNIAEKILKHSIATVLVSAFFLAFLAFGITRLTIDADDRVFFDKDNPQLLQHEENQKIFTKEEPSILTIESQDGDVLNKEILTIISKITHEAWALPYVSRVESVTNFMHSYVEGDQLKVEELLPYGKDLSIQHLERLRATAMSDPGILNILISKDRKLALIYLMIDAPRGDPEINLMIDHHLKNFSHKMSMKFSQVKIGTGGGLLVGAAFANSSIEDMKTEFPIMYLVITIILLYYFRSKTAVILILMTILFSSLIAMGAAGWLGISFNATLAAAPIIIMTLAIADCIHFLTTYYREYHGGCEKKEAILRSYKSNISPIFFTSLTTLIGFLSMNSSAIPPFRDFGNIVCFGVIGAFFISLTLVPALLVLAPSTRKKVKINKLPLECIGFFAIRHRVLILILSIATSIFAVIGFTSMEVNDDPFTYFPTGHSLRDAMDLIDKHIGGGHYIDFTFRANEDGGIYDPIFLKMLDDFSNYARALPNVSQVSTLSDTFKKLSQNLNGDKTDYYRLPDKKELAAQYLLVYELSLPQGRDLTPQLDITKTFTKVSVRLKGSETAEVSKTAAHLEEWFAKKYPENYRIVGTGTSLIWSNIYQQNTKGSVQGSIIAILLISLTFMFLTKSWKMGLISLFPNLIPILASFLLWYLMGRRLDLATGIVVMLTIGIVVDDTIHFLSKFHKALQKKNMSVDESIIYSFKHTGQAIFYTTVVLTAGFSILAITDFRLNSTIGAFTAITLVFALIADFLALPALLSILGKLNLFKNEQRKSYANVTA